MKATPYVISDDNLSHAWGRVVWRVAKSPGPDLQPLLVSVTGFGDDGNPQEDEAVRLALDSFLAKNDKWSVEIVAFTIFPRRYYLVSGGDRKEFYQLCEDALPHLKAKNPNLNGRGLYFERLINFGRGAINFNQLEFILAEYNSGLKRTSAFQASIYDPGRDQTRQPYQTFPCLQTVSFVPTDKGLVVNAFYAMQYLIQRGYGNLLGLAHLGAFMAREMKLPMARLNLVAGVEKLDFPKSKLDPILGAIHDHVKDLDPPHHKLLRAVFLGTGTFEMKVRAYDEIVRRTDQLTPKSATHSNYKIIPILGLAGEIGSLLTELKKRVREPHRANDRGNALIKEELGDIIWYSAAIARRAKLDFGRDVLLANLVKTQMGSGSYAPGIPINEMRRKRRDKPSIKSVATFGSYQLNSSKSARVTLHQYDVLIPYLARIWKNLGELLAAVRVRPARFTSFERQKVAEAIGDVMWYVAGFATLFRLNLDEVVEANALKAQSLFMPLKDRRPTPLHDEADKPLERFPRRLSIDFLPAPDGSSVMLVNGMQLGDPLKDNSAEIDGYRFHDCVHLAFVAVLGWSPVIRALMKRKRKSNKIKDDAQDGARAQIVDEMIVKLTHSYALNIDRKKLLQGRNRVDMDLLKLIQMLAAGLEVQANKLWEWEKAILAGYAMFERLRQERQGRLTLDLIARTVKYSKIDALTATKFPSAS